MIRFDLYGFAHVAIEFWFVEHHFHGSSAEDIGGPHHNGVTHNSGNRTCFLFTAGQTVARLTDGEIAKDRFKLLTILSAIDRFRGGAPNLCSGDLSIRAVEPAQQWNGQFQRRLSTKLHNNAVRTFRFNHVEHVFKRDWFEIQAVACVVVGGNRFGVAVHHHGGDVLLLG